MIRVRSSELGVRSLILASCAILVVFASCGRSEVRIREEFSSPEKTYKVWIDAGVEGDIARALECVSTASKRFMEQIQDREVFVKRMVSSSAAFKSFSVVDTKVSGDKAIILIESPDKNGRISIPFIKEADGWKVDMVAMFGG